MALPVFPELRDMGFEFFMAENMDIDSLKKTLLSTVNYIESNPVPIIKNITLANKMFSREKELSEFIEVLI